jgi:ribonuclease PH
MASKRRNDARRDGELRPVRITPGFVGTADGSCLIEIGRTRVICTASISEELPRWRMGAQAGWVTAEYGMLPASTHQRKSRPTIKPDGRSVEIQRLIGRSLRSVVNFERLGPRTVYLDCDVLEADGGTRTASITGAQVALSIAAGRAVRDGRFRPGAVAGLVAAVSVGMFDGRAVLDLDYSEDSRAEVDMNIVMTNAGKYVEVQGASEARPFSDEDLQAMLMLARSGIRKLLSRQRQAIAEGLKKI